MIIRKQLMSIEEKARKYKSSKHTEEELIEAGIKGFRKACRKFDPKKALDFETFSSLMIDKWMTKKIKRGQLEIVFKEDLRTQEINKLMPRIFECLTEKEIENVSLYYGFQDPWKKRFNRLKKKPSYYVIEKIIDKIRKNPRVMSLIEAKKELFC